MVNKALRIQNIDVLFLFRFVINDIYEQLKQHQCQSTVRAYRGQVMSNDELEILQRSIGKLVSINSFFSTSLDRETALAFLYSSRNSSNLHRVLFEIDADPAVVMSKPFADIRKLSDFACECEVLFMSGCIFRLNDIHQDNDMWVIEVQLCGDSEHDLKTLFDHMKKDYGNGDDEVDFVSFVSVLRRMGKFELAEKMLQRHLNELPPNDPSLRHVYWSLGTVTQDKGDYDASLKWFEKSLEIYMKTNSSDYVSIGNLYNWIGMCHCKENDNETALEYYNKAIALFKKEHTEDCPDMSDFYNNIGIIYQNQKAYPDALVYYEKSLDIRKKHLPDDHSKISTSNYNIGCVYDALGQNDLAMEHHTRALNIRVKSLPPEHLDIAKSYSIIGVIHEKKNEWQDALVNYEKAAKIYRSSLIPQHPYVIEVNEDIRRVSSRQSLLSNVLYFLRKVVAI